MNIENLTSVVRALITSRKQPCTIVDIMKDFREIENADLDYCVKKVGFASCFDYFKSSNEYNVHMTHGAVFVSNKPNAKSAHVSQLVREQKSSKKTSTRLTKPLQLRKAAPSQNRRLESSTYRTTQSNGHGMGFMRNVSQQANALKVTIDNKRRNEEKEIEARVERKRKDLQLLQEEIEKLKQTKAQLEKPIETKSVATHVNVCVNNKENKSNDEAQDVDSEELEEETDLQEAEYNIARLKILKEKISKVTTAGRDTNNNMKSQQELSKNKSDPPPRNELAANDLRHRLTEKRAQNSEQNGLKQPLTKTSNELPKKEDLKTMLRPILGQSQYVSCDTKKPVQANIHLSIEKNEESSTHKLDTVQAAPSQRLQGQQKLQQQQLPLRTQRFPSVQYRLKLRSNGDPDTDNNFAKDRLSKSPPISPVDEPKLLSANAFKIHSTREVSTNRKEFHFDVNLDPCTSLEQYCDANGLEKPQYTVTKTKRGSFLSNCQMDGNTYFAYGMEYPNEVMARQNAALKAISEIIQKMSRKPLPTYPNEAEFLNVLYKELILHPSGIISNKMEDWFAEKFHYSVPKRWFLMVQKSRRFLIENGVTENIYIIHANSAVPNEDVDVVEILKETPVQVRPIQLPWSDKTWNLHVCHCVNTTEIWAHLLGAQYTDEFDTLMLKIDKYMLSQNKTADIVAAKHIYLVKFGNMWSRVRLEAIDKEAEMALVFHIDWGSTERLPLSVLYVCPVEFLDCPPQAVPLSLFGLDDFASFPNAVNVLQKKVLNRTFVGEVLTKKHEFEADNNIQVILFDTSTDDDINMNDLFQEEICRTAPAPQLNQQGYSHVIVTNVDNNSGDVSVQLNIDYVKKTIERVLNEKFSSEQHTCSAKELSRKQLLLVHDRDQWFRAKVADDNQLQLLLQSKTNDVDVMLVDYNVRRRINISQIFRLESMSRALSKYPPQAIRVRLQNIPDFNPNVIRRICELLPVGSEVRVRVDSVGAIPSVTIYRQFDGPAMPLCNINDSLRAEIEKTKDDLLCYKNGSDGPASTQSPDSITSPTQMFRSLTLTSEPMLPLSFRELPKLHEYSPLPEIGSIFHVKVCNVANPMNFSVQPYNNDYAKLLELQTELQTYCDKQDSYIRADKIEEDEAYAAKTVDAYYRVIAKARYGKMINVCRCDYGDSCTVRIDHLKVLPLRFRNLPIMGINARLYGITGRADGIWSSEDVQRFRELVLNEKLASYVRAIDRDENGSLVLTLDLVNVSDKHDVYIREVLIEEKRVLPK